MDWTGRTAGAASYSASYRAPWRSICLPVMQWPCSRDSANPQGAFSVRICHAGQPLQILNITGSASKDRLHPSQEQNILGTVLHADHAHLYHGILTGPSPEHLPYPAPEHLHILHLLAGGARGA